MHNYSASSVIILWNVTFPMFLFSFSYLVVIYLLGFIMYIHRQMHILNIHISVCWRTILQHAAKAAADHFSAPPHSQPSLQNTPTHPQWVKKDLSDFSIYTYAYMCTCTGENIISLQYLLYNTEQWNTCYYIILLSFYL